MKPLPPPRNVWGHLGWGEGLREVGEGLSERGRGKKTPDFPQIFFGIFWGNFPGISMGGAGP